MFNKFLGDVWRNFSVPWYDPGLDPNTEVSKRLVLSGWNSKSCQLAE